MFGKILDWLFGSKGKKKSPKDVAGGLEGAGDYDIRRELEEVMELEDRPQKVKEKKEKPGKKEKDREEDNKKGKGAKKKSKTKKKKTKPNKKPKKKSKKKPKKKSKGGKKKKKTKKEQIVPYLKSRKSPATKKDVAEAVGVTEGTARRYLYYLKKDGKVDKTDDGWVNT